MMIAGGRSPEGVRSIKANADAESEAAIEATDVTDMKDQ